VFPVLSVAAGAAAEVVVAAGTAVVAAGVVVVELVQPAKRDETNRTAMTHAINPK
jgi:hypothetical protein